MSRKPAFWWIDEAVRLEAAGHSVSQIVDALRSQTPKGEKSPGRSTVGDHLKARRDAGEAVPALPPPDPPAAILAGVPVDATDDSELTPDELRRMLSSQIRKAQIAADDATARGDAAEAKAQTKLVAIFSGHLRQIHTKADEDTDVIKVRSGDVQAAADRALAGLHATADRVIAEVQTWPTCAACGAHRGAFAVADVSPIRGMFERVARHG